MVFDPEIEAHFRRQAKAGLRRSMRAVRNSIPESARAERSRKIVARVLASPAFADASGVALFAPMLERNEVDVRPLDAAARDLGKVVAYPLLLEDGSMSLRSAHPDSFAERGYGLAEPPEDAPEIAINAGLLVIVPALAVDPLGHRIGYGKGYYDRLLAKIAPPAVTMSVAYDFQVVAEVPADQHDRAMNYVMTDLREWAITGSST